MGRTPTTLNRDDPPNPKRLEVNVPELDINSDAITSDEIRKAIRHQQNSKAPGYDGIQAKLLKSDIGTVSVILFVMFEQIWQGDRVSDDWQRGLSVKISMKGVTTECTKWREIILLSVVSRMFPRIILTRIQQAFENQLRKGQAGFSKQR